LSAGSHSRYERVLTVYIVLFVFAMIAMFALGLDTLVVYMCIPVISFIVAAYGYSSIALEKILKQSLEFGAKHRTTSSRDAQVALALKAVAVTARQLSALAVLTIAFIVANALVGHSYDRPGNPIGWSVLRPAYLMGSMINLVVLKYISLYTVTKWQTERPQLHSTDKGYQVPSPTSNAQILAAPDTSRDSGRSGRSGLLT